MSTYNISDLSPIQIKPKPPKQPGEPGEPGEGEPQPGEGDGEPQPGEGDGEPQPGEGDGDDTGDEDLDDGDGGKSVDDIHREIEEKLGKKSDSTGTETSKPGEGEPKPGEGKTTNQITKGGSGSLRKIEKKPTPRFSWKALISQFVNTAKRTEPTYAKINKRAVTSMSGIAVTGAGAIKPGERALDEAFKLAMIFDSSGSMWAQIGTSMAETQNLIKQHGSDIAGIIGAGLYGETQPKFFALDLDTKKFWPVAAIADIHKKPPAGLTRPLSDFFSLGGSGGYELPNAGAAAIKTLLSQGYNVIMITDTDISYGTNWTNLVDILKSYKSGFFLILDSERSYQVIVNKLGSAPNNIGHF